MAVDFSKIKEGDLVTFKADASDADTLRRFHLYPTYPKSVLVSQAQIVKHEKAPFDWGTVKNGDLFVDYNTALLKYVGKVPNCAFNDHIFLATDGKLHRHNPSNVHPYTECKWRTTCTKD